MDLQANQGSYEQPILPRLIQVCARWYGIVLTAVVAVSALWLVATGQHTLFIHPRYTVFITEMSALALAACVWALRHLGFAEGAMTSENNKPERVADRPSWRVRMQRVTTASLVIIAIVMVLLVPPAPLSPSMVAQRSIGTNAGSGNSSNIVRTLADLPAEPRISDWAMLLASQTTDDLTGIPVRVEGFVTTDPEIAEHGYYLVRFTIICCAVDAFPARIPIYDPQWRDRVEVGQWLEVSGNFQPTRDLLADVNDGDRISVDQGSSAASAGSGTATDPQTEQADASDVKLPGLIEEYMLQPSEVTPIPEPAEPYLY